MVLVIALGTHSWHLGILDRVLLCMLAVVIIVCQCVTMYYTEGLVVL